MPIFPILHGSSPRKYETDETFGNFFFSTVIEFHRVKFVRKAMTLSSNNLFNNAKLAAEKHIALNSLMHSEPAFQIVSFVFLEQIFNLPSAYYLLARSNRIVFGKSHCI